MARSTRKSVSPALALALAAFWHTAQLLSESLLDGGADGEVVGTDVGL